MLANEVMLDDNLRAMNAATNSQGNVPRAFSSNRSDRSDGVRSVERYRNSRKPVRGIDLMPPTRTSSVGSQTGRCFECNDEGHWAKECPKRKAFRKDRNSSNDAHFQGNCNRCGRRGHKAVDCRSDQR